MKISLTQREQFKLIDQFGNEVTTEELSSAIKKLKEDLKVYESESYRESEIKENLALFNRITRSLKQSNSNSLVLFRGIDTNSDGKVDIPVQDRSMKSFALQEAADGKLQDSNVVSIQDLIAFVAPHSLAYPNGRRATNITGELAGEAMLFGTQYYLVDYPSSSSGQLGIPNILVGKSTSNTVWSLENLSESIESMGYVLHTDENRLYIEKDGKRLSHQELVDLSVQIENERFLNDSFDNDARGIVGSLFKENGVSFASLVEGAGHVGENNLMLQLLMNSKYYYIDVEQDSTSIGTLANPTSAQLLKAVQTLLEKPSQFEADRLSQN